MYPVCNSGRSRPFRISFFHHNTTRSRMFAAAAAAAMRGGGEFCVPMDVPAVFQFGLFCYKSLGAVLLLRLLLLKI